MEDCEDTSGNNLIEINSVSENGEGDYDANLGGNPKLADAINKVLRMAQKKPKNKSIVLSKAKLYQLNKKEEKVTCAFEILPGPDSEVIKEEEIEEEEEKDVKHEVKDIKKKDKGKLSRHEKLKRGRVIPDILDKEKERKLAKIATSGVVQLFNAVKKQQSSISKQLKENGLTETKREKILKSIDRKGFLDALSNCGNISLKMDVSDEGMKEEVKEENACDEEENNEKLSWEVLRGDFMMGAKLKDWDKKEDEELSS